MIIINRRRVAVNSTLAGLSAEISECTRLKLRVLAPRAVARGLFRDMAEISDIELQTADEKGAVGYRFDLSYQVRLKRKALEIHAERRRTCLRDEAA